MKSPAHYTSQIKAFTKQRDSLKNIQLTLSQSKLLREYYSDKIKEAIENRNAARAANITVIDPIYL